MILTSRIEPLSWPTGKRGYPKQLLEEHFHNASLFNQDELLDIKIKDKKEKQVFVTTSNLANPDLMATIWNY